MKRLAAKIFLALFVLVINCSCRAQESVITIVDIGNLDRVGLAKHLGIVNKFSPKVIGLYFLLTTDSLGKDLQLAKEITRTKNIVQSSKLHKNDSKFIHQWDSLEVFHPKFRHGNSGFSNLTITDDSVIVYELPMRQYFRKETVQAFSYMVADKYNSNWINPIYKSGARDFKFDRNCNNQSYKVISVTDLQTGRFNKNDLTNKIVLLGHVNEPYPLYSDHQRIKKISSVEVQACFIQSIMR